MARGRTLGSMGQAFIPVGVDHALTTEVTVQVAYRRTWGIPTGPGYFVGPGKWNVLIPPILIGFLYKLLDLIIDKKV
jgi:hypothetical protein